MASLGRRRSESPSECFLNVEALAAGKSILPKKKR